MPQAMLELTSFEPESAQADAGTVESDGGHAKLHANDKDQQQAGEVQDLGFTFRVQNKQCDRQLILYT